jgi:hypothetical protein
VDRPAHRLTALILRRQDPGSPVPIERLHAVDEESMSEQPARTASAERRWLPWAAAGVLALLCGAIIAVLPHVRGVSNRADAAASSAKGTVALPLDVQKAVQAGATEAANVLTYSRKNFDADWNRSLAGATGKLRSDHEADKATTLERLTSQKVDLVATVQHSAFETAEDAKVLVLVTVTGTAVNDQGERSAQTPQRLELTMVKSGDKWLASDLTMIGIQ